jgi:hypothetical protein
LQNFAEAVTLHDVSEQADTAAFGVELERRRELLRPHMAANEAGRRAGLSGQWWRHIERGLRNAPRNTVIRMALVVGWDPEDALRWAGYEGDVTDEERRLPADPRQVIEAHWDRLTDRQRDVAANVVLAFAEPHPPLGVTSRGEVTSTEVGTDAVHPAVSDEEARHQPDQMSSGR